MKKTNWTNNTDIRLGFEVECVIRRDGYRNFCRSVHALHPRMSIGQDWSIRTYGCGFGGPYGDGARTAEVQTPPLPSKDAMILLKKLFDLVNKHGATNASCGFHVNISSANKSKMKRFNPLPFLSSKLWNEILRKFKRESNKYCKAMMDGSKYSHVRLLKRMTGSFKCKYWAVNLSNYRDDQRSSRVEIRAFGNRRYTQKYDLIARYVKKIEKLFNLSCGNALSFTRTFRV